MDFFNIVAKETKQGGLDIKPGFVVGYSKDLMVRGKSFYAIWDDPKNIWSTNEFDVQRLVDDQLRAYAKNQGDNATVQFMRNFGSNQWNQWRKFVSQLPDNAHQLDNELTFANTDVKKSDYVSRRLPYSLKDGDCSAWNELLGVLYAPEERAKIEWAIGAVVSGDAKKLQKFLVLYGPAGTGKSTVLNIIQKLFSGYTTTFEAKALGSNNGSFATEVFKANPLVAIQHDGDLSKIEDNTRLNSIISHEDMTLNEKYKPSYTSRINAFLFMGTNQPVRISDAKSGIIRRLIDVHPTGKKLSNKDYNTLMGRIDFELGAIAAHCLKVYKSMGKTYYNGYEPTEMMLQTDVFFNFVEYNYDIFSGQDGVTLRQAYKLYKDFCEETGIERPLPQYKVREELRNYFEEFHDRAVIDGTPTRSWYAGFKGAAYKAPINNDPNSFRLVLESEESLFDKLFADCPSQYAKEDGSPEKRWVEVTTKLSDLDTTKLHYVKTPHNIIVIDFDLKDDSGGKSLARNLEAAALWPATYAEYSKSGEGIHLHYNYTGGDPTRLSQDYAEGIEVKYFSGNSSLRRLRRRSNELGIADISSGLPLKEEKVLTSTTIQSEQGLRAMIARNLRKEIHPGTKPSVDFIHKILEEAFAQPDFQYDVSDLRSNIIAFATNSTNQPLQCLKTVQKMQWKSKDPSRSVSSDVVVPAEQPIVFYDVEVYPNLFVICWKYAGAKEVVRMVNPKPHEVEALFSMKLVGFNNRKYDNHIIYAASLGYTNHQLYLLSKKIIESNDKSNSGLFGKAYDISHADIYEFSSVKMGLKKFQILLGIHHQEIDIPFDDEVSEGDITRVVDYCVNDVISTEVVFESRKQDYVARQILADLSGLTINDTTQRHTAKIIFGNDRNPQASFVYTDLSVDFPGYKFDATSKTEKSTYRGETVGEGGYVYAEPGVYRNVALLDIASMHPTSIEQLNAFGEYTPRFSALKQARVAIKHKNYDAAREMLNGKLAPYLANPDDAKALSDALKIVINIVYGLTSATFDNPFRDRRNLDNIVAKRGALFMIDLKHEVQTRGFTVAHIKTDSIKIPDATQEIIDFVVEYGKKWGYDFELEGFYSKFALFNDAVYVAKKDECISNCWVAVGAQFQHPYVFKTLFNPTDGIVFDDLCETKQVSKGVMKLDYDSVKPMHTVDTPTVLHHVGRTGRFIPVDEGYGGGILYRLFEDKLYAVAGTKGHLWLEAEKAQDLPEDAVDFSYYDKLLDAAREQIAKFAEDVDDFINF